MMEGTFTISTAQTFATNWLVENIDAFQELHPTLSVRLETTQRLAAFNTEDVDVAIRGGHGPWQGLERHLLVAADFTPMLSPRLADTIGGISTPEDLLKLPLLDLGDPWWTIWFGAIDIKIDSDDRPPMAKLGGQSMLARAAIAGRGVAMLTPALYRTELEAGLLLKPFERTEADGLGYWLVYPEGRRNAPKIRAFRDWILRSLQEEEAGRKSR